jgi:phage terminase small subunit
MGASKHIKTGLTPMQESFIREFCLDRNQTQAALRAGYGKGVNRMTAQGRGRDLMRQPNIRKAIDAQIAKLGKKTETDSQWVRRRLREEAEDTTIAAAARVRAIELIGKLNGDFVEDRKNNRSPLADMETSDLERLERAIAGLPDCVEPGEPGPTTH